jgi:hypothetical protein
VPTTVLAPRVPSPREMSRCTFTRVGSRNRTDPRQDQNSAPGRVSGHCQNVLMNSIRARLSSSLSGCSLPKALSSSLRLSVLLNSSVPK